MNFRGIFLFVFVAWLVGAPIRGALMPYTVDSTALSLWHLSYAQQNETEWFA